MKESELIQLKNKVKNLEGMMSAILGQQTNLKDLALGTLETVKRMDGYQKALDQLKEDLQTGSSKETTEEQELIK